MKLRYVASSSSSCIIFITTTNIIICCTWWSVMTGLWFRVVPCFDDSNVNAFVVPTTTNVRQSNVGSGRTIQKELNIATHGGYPESMEQQHVHRSSSVPTQLYMGGGASMVDRFTRVVKSNVNKWVSNMENPEKVINQSVNDLQNDLVQVRQSYAEAIANQRRIQRQVNDVDRIANEWYSRAQLALRQQQKQQPQGGGSGTAVAKNTERLAREALLRREMELERRATIQKQLDTQTIATDQLYNAIVTLERQIREVMSKQQQLVARARTAEATQQVQSVISSGQFDSTTALSNSMNAFTRMEQKVEAMEAAVEASIELNQIQWSLPTSGSDGTVSKSTPSSTERSLEDDFRYLEQSSKVEEEMEFLKRQLNFGVTAIDPAATTATSFIPNNEEPMSNRVVSIPITRRDKSISVL